jgi:prevent-host-death family protein
MVIMLVNIAEAKAKLSELVEAAARGEQVVICNRNQPIAELRAIEPARETPRDLTPVFPDWKIDTAFFEPLDDEDLAEWYGDSVGPSRVAESTEPYPSKRRRTRR